LQRQICTQPLASKRGRTAEELIATSGYVPLALDGTFPLWVSQVMPQFATSVMAQYVSSPLYRLGPFPGGN